MKENQNDKELMNYIDEVSNNLANEKLRSQGDELKTIVAGLKDLPLNTISPETDKRLYQFIEDKSDQHKPVINLKRWIPLFTVAASIILFLFVFNTKENFKEDYQKLISNPDKLSFIYNLNNQKLSSTDINWLKEELRKENNPNIKVTIIDLLSNDRSKLNKDFYNNLQYESIPTVQMAFLNSLEASENINFKSELLSFLQRNDLDTSVKLKAKIILSN